MAFVLLAISLLSTVGVRASNVTVHTVTVGKAENAFVPDSVNASVGDTVSFQFYPTNHSVIRSAFGYPCVPIEDVDPTATPFFSGFQPILTVSESLPTWNITINDTMPIFYYCGAPGSCIDWGMLGVINANSTGQVLQQQALAKQADYMLEPGQPFPNEEVAASMSSLAASMTTETLTATATVTAAATTSAVAPDTHTSSHHSSGLSPGAIAGIAIGAAAVLALAAALFFFLGRTKSLKNALRNNPSSPSTSSRPNDAPVMGSPGTSYGNPHNSQLPAYQPMHMVHNPDEYEAKMQMQRDYPQAMDMGIPRQASPGMEYTPYSGTGFIPAQHEGRSRFSETSELGGSDVRYSAPPVVHEMGTPDLSNARASQ